MIIPDRLLVGTPERVGPTAFELVELAGGAANLPTPADARAAADGRTITLVASAVITHRRNDPLYKLMHDPAPEHAAVGHFERSRWTDEAWEQTDALASAVDAQAVTLRTPPTFRPTAEHATRLENFVAQAARPGLAIAWEWAPGSWPTAKALDLSDRIGLIPVVDPTETAIHDAEYVYLRFRGGRSGRKAVKDDDLKQVALAVRDRIGWVVFDNSTAAEDARRFIDML